MEEVKNGGCESICIKNEELPPKDVKYDESHNEYVILHNTTNYLCMNKKKELLVLVEKFQ